MTSVVICTTLSPDTIKNYNYVFSDFGAEDSTQAIFNTGLITTGILFALFGSELSLRLKEKKVEFIFLLPGVLLSLVGIISLDVEETVHLITFASFLFAWYFMILYTSLNEKVKRVKLTSDFLQLSTALTTFWIFFFLLFYKWIWLEIGVGVSVFLQVFILTDFLVFKRDRIRLFRMFRKEWN